MKNVINFVLIPVVFIFISCSTTTVKNGMKGESFVFGYIDMSDAPSDFGWLTMRDVKPGLDDPDISASHDGKGLFWFYNIKKGSYRLSSFGGQSFGCLKIANRTKYIFGFPKYGDGSVFLKVKRPGIYYLGSYKVKTIKTGLFSQDKFQIIPVNKPERKKLIMDLLQYTKGTNWDQQLKNLL